MKKFSVALGLFDYINPILYSITSICIIKNIETYMNSPYSIIFIIGSIISIIFGLAIPTVKLLVGLGKMEFKMPVNLVFLVNTGILLSGIMLFKSIININTYLYIMLLIILLGLLLMLYKKNKKFNTIAVLIGAIGYMLMYISLIGISINSNIIISIMLYAIAILIFIFLCGVGIKANLKDPKTHWIIEISNVICQLLVTISTIILL